MAHGELAELLSAFIAAIEREHLGGVGAVADDVAQEEDPPDLALAQVVDGRLSREDYLERYGHRGPHEMELFAPGAEDDPAWLEKQRDVARQTFDRLPLPTRRDVDWQRFDIRKLKLDKVDAPALTEKLSASPGNSVIFCDMATALAKHGDLTLELTHESLICNGETVYTSAGLRDTATANALLKKATTRK